jgi:hypothetical protein
MPDYLGAALDFQARAQRTPRGEERARFLDLAAEYRERAIAEAVGSRSETEVAGGGAANGETQERRPGHGMMSLTTNQTQALSPTGNCAALAARSGARALAKEIQRV